MHCIPDALPAALPSRGEAALVGWVGRMGPYPERRPWRRRPSRQAPLVSRAAVAFAVCCNRGVRVPGKKQGREGVPRSSTRSRLHSTGHGRKAWSNPGPQGPHHTGAARRGPQGPAHQWWAVGHQPRRVGHPRHRHAGHGAGRAVTLPRRPGRGLRCSGGGDAGAAAGFARGEAPRLPAGTGGAAAQGGHGESHGAPGHGRPRLRNRIAHRPVRRAGVADVSLPGEVLRHPARGAVRQVRPFEATCPGRGPAGCARERTASAGCPARVRASGTRYGGDVWRSGARPVPERRRGGRSNGLAHAAARELCAAAARRDGAGAWRAGDWRSSCRAAPARARVRAGGGARHPGGREGARGDAGGRGRRFQTTGAGGQGNDERASIRVPAWSAGRTPRCSAPAHPDGDAARGGAATARAGRARSGPAAAARAGIADRATPARCFGRERVRRGFWRRCGLAASRDGGASGWRTWGDGSGPVCRSDAAARGPTHVGAGDGWADGASRRRAAGEGGKTRPGSGPGGCRRDAA